MIGDFVHLLPSAVDEISGSFFEGQAVRKQCAGGGSHFRFRSQAMGDRLCSELKWR